MEILYTKLPERALIYEYLTKVRADYTHLSLGESDYEIVRALPEFFPLFREGEDGRIAGLTIIVE